MSPTGSPATSLLFIMLIFASIASNTSSIPVLVGFRPTFSMISSDPGIMLPATSQNAAELISPGTIID